MNRIKELREAKKWTQSELASRMGTSDATVQRLETGKRKLREKWIRIAAEALECHVAEILEQLPPTSPGMPVLGNVQAGHWQEVDVDYEPVKRTLPVGNDPRYQSFPQYALHVVGDSMNKVFPDGQYIVCVPWNKLGRELKHDDLVIVERRKPGLTEATVKRVKITRGRAQLVPESTNPRWQTPIVLNGSEDEDVVVTGLVIGRYEPL